MICNGTGTCVAKTANGGTCQSNGECQSANCSSFAVTGTNICCQSGYSNCGSCVDRQSDSSNCGSCSTKCGANRTCQTGSCKCAGFAFPAACGGCGSWSFESATTESWGKDTNISMNGVTNVLATQTTVHDGAYALAVPILDDGVTAYVGSVNVPLCQSAATINTAGFTMSAWVKLSGPQVGSLSALFFEASSALSGTDSSPVLFGDQITPNTWIFKTVTFGAALQADHIGIRLSPSPAQWAGTLYVDSVQITGP